LEIFMTLEERYAASKSTTIVAAKAMGTVAGRQGVNFTDGTQRGPWNPTSNGTADVWQGEFKENVEGAVVTPAASNLSTYPLSRWTAESLKIAFENKGPAKLPTGYFGNTRFTVFKDSAGRWTEEGSKLHKYAPLTGKKFQNANTWANTRITAGAVSTTVRGLVG
jgi:hypothetical protein